MVLTISAIAAARKAFGLTDRGVEATWKAQNGSNMSGIRSVCVYCASGPGNVPAFMDAAAQFGRILAEIHGRGGLFESAALAKDDVHQIPGSGIPSPALMAVSSISACSPIRTSFDRLGRVPHGMSN